MDAEERLSRQFMNAPAFKSFAFPVIDISKTDMDDIAREKGWEEIMYLTNFCRRPPKVKPCGVCGPCADAVIRGMGFRLPFWSRMKAHLLIPLRKYWRNSYEKNKDKRLFRLIERKLVGRL